MKVLGIETSADDTGVAVIEAAGTFGPGFHFSALANEVASQTHAAYGGIYPNLAKNEHKKNLPILLEKVMARNEKPASPDEGASRGGPDVIAVTVGPGIEPCLWTGITFAQKLAADWNVPVVAVNHLEGHIIMSMMDFVNPSSGSLSEFEFPVLSLLISGGNTQLVLSKEPMQYEVVGKTRDDAVGEAFDKVARMMGLPYPGGPHISRLAAEARKTHEASPRGFALPRPMLREGNLDFSFSGLKTAVLRHVEKWQGKTLPFEFKKEIAREFEEACADVLVGKTLRAVEEYGVGTVVTSGGVSANAFIRLRLAEALAEAGAKFLVCPPQFSTDNAAMIALAGYFHALKKEFTDPENLTANGNLRLTR